ncbi:MAG: hypothetical protein JST00_24465 [Deltaproteobacteria bacterium]|nr:hypothetical protein [Deltaproteobacteria bacterium]
MKKASVRSRLAVVCLGVMLASCSKDPPPKPDDGPKKSTPVPSDMVFNDFVPPTGAGGGIVGVKGADGGLTAGDLGTTAGGDGGAAGAGAAGDGAGAAADPNAFKVTDPGAEPRVARRYAFVANKTEKRVLTSKQSASGEGAPPGEIAIAIAMELTPKVVKPTGTRFELKVASVDMPDVPAAQKGQVAAALGIFKGLTAQFDLTKQGEVGEIDFKADEKLQQAGQLAELVLNAIQQGLDLLVPTFPDAPIGVGAKWERTAERRDPRGLSETNKRVYTLKEATAEGGVVDVESNVTVPKTPVQGRRGGPPMTLEVSQKGTHSYAFKLAGISTKVQGETSATQKIEMSDGKQKQAQSIATKAKITLESK